MGRVLGSDGEKGDKEYIHRTEEIAGSIAICGRIWLWMIL
jgi:hypothetical protein